ncbi:MAG: efflux RND transporter permease subunit [Candidatus Omnitrophota bacterium]|nr:efflux RND transporter permease subunit [Candidatus Omnitrophota bacterium]
MNISKLSVNRPVTAIMVFTAVLLLGFISWSKLPQELFPSITYPQITVVTSYENAAPEEIESLITKIIEEATGTVNNVKRISSISKEGLSLVIVEFNWGTNMDFAALNVREKIDLIKERLPREAEEPIVMKYNPFDLPIMNLAVTGPMPSLELRETCRKYIKEAIEKAEGVASVIISGGAEREIVVEIDQPRLRASQISIISIVDSLKKANLNYPAGTIKESFYEYLIRTMGEYQDISEIQETPTALDLPEEEAETTKEKEEKEKKGRRLVYIKDVALVHDTVKEKTSISRYNGKDSISLVIRKQSGTNTMNVVKKVKTEIQKLLSEKLPPGIKIEVTYDQSQFIRAAIANVRNAAIQGGILAFFVLLFFLRQVRSSVVITVSMPISIMATFCLMYFNKINLNMMSLGGLALGVGMLVDNAVVVIENIFRHRQMDKGLSQACIDGAGEMTGPIIGSTLTTVAVFIPFAFVTGIAGQIFKQLSMTITFSLLMSIVIAISLVPVLISLGRRQFRSSSLPGAKGTKQSRFLRLLRPFPSLRSGLRGIRNDSKGLLNKWTEDYGDFISGLLSGKLFIIAVVFAAFLISLVILAKQERRFLPSVDQRQFIVKVDMAPGTRLSVTNQVATKIEQLLLKLKEIKNVTINIGSSEEKASAEATLQTMGSHQAQVMVNLKKLSFKKGMRLSTEEVIQYLKNNLRHQDLQGGQIEYIAQESSLSTTLEEGAPIVVEVSGPNLERLTDISKAVQQKICKIKGVYGVKNSLVLSSPETKLHIIKDRASLYGLSVRDIALTAQVALKGYVATKFKEKDGEEIDIRVRLRPEDRSDMSMLRRLLIHSPLAMNIPLSEVAYLTKGTGPTEIRRVGQQRTILVTANIFNRPLGKVTNEISAVLDSTREKFPFFKQDYSFRFAGEQQKMSESFQSLAFALILAFVLVYMIMAAEFESLWQPFIIMFTVPLSLIGVSLILFITRTPLSVVAYLGIIMLGGIVVNNGIVLIDFINRMRKQGHEPKEAVILASKTRLRPILMTSLTTVLGLTPLALGIGEGAELRAPLALTVIGGLTSATFLTLVIIPALYLTVAERIKPKLTEEKPEEVKPEVEAKPEIKSEAKIEAKPEVKPKPEPPPQTEELNLRQTEVLEKLKTINKITRKQYAGLFNVSTPTAARDLKQLLDKKLLQAHGPLGPGRWYEISQPVSRSTGQPVKGKNKDENKKV